LRVPVPDAVVGTAHSQFPALLTVSQGLCGVLELGDVNAVTDNVAARRAVLHDQQPPAVGQPLLNHLAAGVLVLCHPLLDPCIHVADGLCILAALCTLAHNHFKGVARHNQVPAGFVELFICLVALDQPVFFIVDGEALGNAADRIAQQAAGLLRRLLRLHAFLVFCL